MARLYDGRLRRRGDPYAKWAWRGRGDGKRREALLWRQNALRHGGRRADELPNLSVSGGAAPEYDGAGSLGFSDYRWSVVYAQTGTITTSDREKKTDISYALERYDALFEKLRPASYRLKSGTSGRTHTGLVAQDVEQALASCGLTGQDFAAFVKTQREDGGADYGLRYEELIALCIRQIQMLRERVRKLEETA